MKFKGAEHNEMRTKNPQKFPQFINNAKSAQLKITKSHSLSNSLFFFQKKENGISSLDALLSKAMCLPSGGIQYLSCYNNDLICD